MKRLEESGAKRVDNAPVNSRLASWEDTRRQLGNLPQYLRIRPDTGKLWLDALYLIVIAVAQYSVLPQFFGQYLSVDLMTPWLITAFVRQPPHRHLLLGLLGGVLWETHSSAPVGTYLCAYWILAVMVGTVKETFSWHHWIPWLVTFAVAELALVVFEIVLIFVSRDPGTVDFYYSFAQLLRIGAAAAFGALLCRKWIIDAQNEAATS